MSARTWALGAALAALAPVAALHAQASGALAGTVRDAATGQGIGGAVVTLGDGRRGAVTDTGGAYRVREVRSGSYDVQIRAIGYAPVARSGVTVRGGETTRLDAALQARATELAPLAVPIPFDPVLDPMATSSEHVITAEDLRTLPVSSLDEALTLAPGATGESYRGGRLGEQAFIVDGLGVKNQLDASTGALGLRLPPDLLTEASLITNGFSARYGQALSGLVNVVTKDGGPTWAGRLAYETDRPLGGSADLGLDRVVAEADGPVFGGATAVVSFDATGRLDADPVSAPAATDPADPRFSSPIPLPHNSGQQATAGGKLTIPLGHETIRIFGLRSVEDRLLYDQEYKYDAGFAPGQRTTGTLGSVQLQHASGPGARTPIIADLRLGYYGRDFVRGAPAAEPDRFFGAFSTHPLHVVGEEIAAAQDTAAARAPLAGFQPPTFSSATPWGVPAFFLTGGALGDITWSRFREVRGQLDVTLGTGSSSDLYVGAELSRQTVRTFQRALAYLPVGDTVPPATASYFQPLALAAYLEEQVRLGDLAITAGMRFDRFDARNDLPGQRGGAKQQFNPRFGVSTVLEGATVVVSGGSFSQPPDYQYLVDATFDDSARTGRFRRGNPNLGFERSWQWEMSVRHRVAPGLAVRAGAYLKRLEGLVASLPLGVNPDSSIFANNDAGTVRGLELRLERDIAHGWGVRAYYTLQEANATSTSAFTLRRAIRIDPLTHDTIIPAQVEIPLDYDRRHTLTLILQGRAAGFEGAAIGRVASGLPYTKLPTQLSTKDTIIATPNGARLPGTSSVDVLLRRPLQLLGVRGGVYLDVRNVLNRRNIIAVRRDSGLPTAADATITTLAENAYQSHSEPIPYESPRYRAAADLDRNGLIEGRSELFPLFLAAARDFSQPIFAYGTPRLWRLGMEVVF